MRHSASYWLCARSHSSLSLVVRGSWSQAGYADIYLFRWGSRYVAQTGLLLQPPEYWDCNVHLDLSGPFSGLWSLLLVKPPASDECLSPSSGALKMSLRGG